MDDKEIKHQNPILQPSNSHKVKLMCSYGGKVCPRPHDHLLSYVGGNTKILTVDRNISFSDLVTKVQSLCDSGPQFCLKYQLPGQDLDALISVLDDDDVDHMMIEYDHVRCISPKPVRIRLFVFLPTVISPVVARSGSLLNPDFLFGFDKEYTDHHTTYSAPNSEILKNLDTVFPWDVGSEHPLDLPPPQIQGITPEEVYSCDNMVRSGSYAFPAAPLFYQVPVQGGGFYQVGNYGGMQRVIANGGSNREQPVYNFFPVMPSAQERNVGNNVGPHVSINYSDGFVGYDAAPLNPTVTMAATSNQESKRVSQQDA